MCTLYETFLNDEVITMVKGFRLILFTLLCMLSLTALAADTEKNTKEKLNLEQPIEIITVEEMESRLQDGNKEDILYVKVDKEQVEVYHNTTKDRGLRRQIAITAPEDEMLRLYTNNRETYRQMSKLLYDYEDSRKSFNGYRIIADVETPKKLKNGEKIYRFWFMKVEKSAAGRDNSRMPIDIGIGIGIGGGHHHGPWIGIGW